MITLCYSDSIIITLCAFMHLLIMSPKKRKISICKSQMLWLYELLNWVRVTCMISILVHLTKLPKQWKSMDVHGQLWHFFSNKNWINPLYGRSFAKSIKLGMLIICAQLLHPFFSLTSNFQTILKNTLFYFNEIKGTL
jgi:hypothetical protein